MKRADKVTEWLLGESPRDYVENSVAPHFGAALQVKNKSLACGSSNILPVQVYKIQVPSPPWCVINNIIFRHWQLFSGEQNHFQLKTTDLISSSMILVFSFSFYISLCVYIILLKSSSNLSFTSFVELLFLLFNFYYT